MNKVVPTITESADELKALLKQERHHAKRQRIQLLYLLASGQARFRREAAQILGVDRTTVGTWLRLYETGGLPALLAIYIPAGKQPPLAPDQLAKLHQALQRPEGFASYGEIQRWIEVVLFFQPPYAPEVNPSERVWQAFKTEIAWHCFADLEQLRQYLVAVLARYNEPMLHSLTSYPYLMDVINAVCA